MTTTTNNFQVGQIWISRKRTKYRILSVDTENITCWFPLLLENTDSKVMFTADSSGAIFDNFQKVGDNLIMQVDSNFGVSNTEKDLASRMLKVYNANKTRMEQDRVKSNEKVKKSYRLIKNNRGK